MDINYIKTSAPGSLMLLGEYSVLTNGRAIGAAVAQRVSLILTPRSDRNINIETNLGDVKTTLDAPDLPDYLQFIDEAIKYKKVCVGFDLKIQSTLSHTKGFGSSAACILCLMAAFDCLEMKKSVHGNGQIVNSKYSRIEVLEHLLLNGNEKQDLWIASSQGGLLATTVGGLSSLRAEGEAIHLLNGDGYRGKLFDQCLYIVQKIQGGIGSGADIAFSLYGGICYFQKNPFKVERLAIDYPLTSIYSGKKRKTKDVVLEVFRAFQNFPHIFDGLLFAIDRCVEDGLSAIYEKDWKKLGQIFCYQQKLMEILDLSNSEIELILDNFMQKSLGGKISGSGKGDSIIFLGQFDDYPIVEIDEKGLFIEVY